MLAEPEGLGGDAQAMCLRHRRESTHFPLGPVRANHAIGLWLLSD